MQEGWPGDDNTPDGAEPLARIILSLIDEEDSSNEDLIAEIASPLNGITIAGIMGMLFIRVYRAGRRRGQV